MADLDDPQVGPSPVPLRPGLLATPLHAVVDELEPQSSPDHVVLVNVGRPFRLVETLDGEEHATRGAPGDVAVIPAGVGLALRSADGTPQQVDALGFSLTSDLLEEVLDSAGIGGPRRELVPAVGARSPQVARLAGLVQAGLPDRTGLGRLALESLGHALVVAVAQEHVVRSIPVPRGGGLSTQQLSRVLRHVEDELAGPLSLVELAAVAHVSPFHFARLFRESTGSSPHQYVVQRRVARARELLVDSSLPLSEVAVRCGFADQSHLGRHVRRLLGVTPGALRASAAAR